MVCYRELWRKSGDRERGKRKRGAYGDTFPSPIVFTHTTLWYYSYRKVADNALQSVFQCACHAVISTFFC